MVNCDKGNRIEEIEKFQNLTDQSKSSFYENGNKGEKLLVNCERFVFSSCFSSLVLFQSIVRHSTSRQYQFRSFVKRKKRNLIFTSETIRKSFQVSPEKVNCELKEVEVSLHSSLRASSMFFYDKNVCFSNAENC